MSGYLGCNASRSLLRLAGPGLFSRTSKTTCLVATRWLSCSAYAGRPTIIPSQSAWSTSRLRNTASAPPTQRYGDCRTFFTPKVIREYEELPRDYRDQIGLSFSGRDLSQPEVAQIFGPDVTAKAANHLLRILHGRRVAGTLEDPVFAIHTAQFTDEQISLALRHLRKVAPVEEVRNAGLRAEDELEQIELENEKRQSPAQAADKEVADSTQEPDSIYGRSHFDAIRARNVAKQKVQERALEEERMAKEAEEGSAAAGPLAKHQGQKREIANPRIAEYYKNAQSEMDAPPEMSPWARIVPSATVVLLAIGFFSALAMVYEEPIPHYRLMPDITMSQATVGALIAMNAAVFLAWRVPPLWSFFNRYMIFVVATVKPVTLFTAAFSHTKLSHLMMNMVPLWFVGTCLHDDIGRADFLTLYVSCGAMGFLGSLATYTLRGWLTVTSLGASGATLGLCSAYFWEHRTDGFKIFGLPQDGVHGIVFLALITAVQLAGLGTTARLKVDIASHLVGIATGILGIEIIGRSRRKGENKVEGEGEKDKEVVIELGKGGLDGAEKEVVARR